MLHLSPERLAALADDEPSAVEAAHLAACPACAAERRAGHRLLLLARAERATVREPLTSWTGVLAAARADGLVAGPDERDARTPARHVAPLPAARFRRPLRAALRRAAAVLLLVGGGAMVGRVSAGETPVPGLAVGGLGGARADTDSLAPAIATSEDAMLVLQRAERDYRAAAAFLAVRDTAGFGAERPEVYQARLAALDEVAAVTRAALYEAPHDPIINQYYLASLGAREATLRQLGTQLPAGTLLSRF